MSAASGNEIVTYWLIPADPARTHLASVIRHLARRLDAPIFEPHVTIYVTAADEENPGEVLAQLAKGRGPYRLQIHGLDSSDKFTKTLFVEFDPHSGLARFSEELRRASATQNDYQLNPHLSLLYKKMDEATKSELVSEITLPFSEIVFDSVQAVISPAKIESRAQVESWRTVAIRHLAT